MTSPGLKDLPQVIKEASDPSELKSNSLDALYTADELKAIHDDLNETKV